jgi:hypothetical protein
MHHASRVTEKLEHLQPSPAKTAAKAALQSAKPSSKPKPMHHAAVVHQTVAQQVAPNTVVTTTNAHAVTTALHLVAVAIGHLAKSVVTTDQQLVAAATGLLVTPDVTTVAMTDHVTAAQPMAVVTGLHAMTAQPVAQVAQPVAHASMTVAHQIAHVTTDHAMTDHAAALTTAPHVTTVAATIARAAVLMTAHHDVLKTDQMVAQTVPTA